MRILLKVIIILVIIVFAGIQFYQPEKNISKDFSNHIFENAEIPKNIKNTFTNACLDCHSNQTNYLWYHKISPVSWMISKHIEDGKEELNLSEWGEMDIFDKIETLEEICRETERKKMPLNSYTLMHRNAKLSEKQIEDLCKWTSAYSQKLIESLEK